MTTMPVALSDLLPGDVLVDVTPPLVVKGIQIIGPVVIVDFTDDTATAPIPNGLVTIQKRAGK